MTDYRLSDHFWLSEFLRSEIAARQGIDNTPGPEVLANLRWNAVNMEQVRLLLNAQVHPSSVYRCEQLERFICDKDFARWCVRHGHLNDSAAWAVYFAAKGHPKGLCTDFEAPSFGPPISVCDKIAASGIGFDQLIWEHDWTHIGWPAPGAAPRRQVLTLMKDGSYANGIVGRAA
ncbi:MAG TPA: peptidase M15 [Burkholderiales bacterium]|nr:peptidase M15 [Burkholderiales bacterium]